MRKKIRIFVSYAVKYQALALDFVERLKEDIAPSKAYEYDLWIYPDILIGEQLEKEIIGHIESCDCAILLVSNSFLKSEYVKERELPLLFAKQVPLLPVMLREVDLKLHDLQGLERYQIFRLQSKRYTEPRAYADVRANRRDEFIRSVFKEIETRLTKENIGV